MKTKIKQIGKETCLSLQEIYCNTVLETREGNKLAICMRDDTIELNLLKDGQTWWHRVNIDTGTIEPMDPKPLKA